MMNFDLHSHSHFSDGSLSPTALVELAAAHGVSHLALTDHDTVAGLDEAQAAAIDSGLTLINGVELSCSWENQLLHIVGLNIDPNNSALRKGIESNRGRRFERAELMYQDLEKHDIDLRELVQSNLQKGAVPTRPHFAQALVELSYAKNLKQAFKRYLVRGKPGFVPMQWPGLEQVGQWINNSGGVAVLAHPLRYKFTRTKLIRLITEMVPAGVQALEVSTPTTDKQQIAMLGDLSKQHDLAASIGSDFHSPNHSWTRLGSAQPLSKDLNPVWSQF
ncbi:MAG: putative metal-dependent phosphoesterase TrpH [Cryomorphaceae bacterium]|jgi:predicted metal-dependent phosphoesterase TrpH